MHKQFGKVRERMVFMHELDKTMESDSVQQLGKPDSLTTGTVSSRSTSTTREVFPDETDQVRTETADIRDGSRWHSGC